MEDGSIESRIQQALRSRVQHFRDQAESLTFEGVRRLLEKDLALDPYALDVHKRYVKQSLEKYLAGTEDDENVSKDSEQIKLEQVKEEQPKEHNIHSEDEGKIEDSPVMGLLTGNESAQSGNSKDGPPTEDMIKDALWKKAAYLRSKSEEITVAGVRRILEEDLKLEKFSLDSFKKLISKQLDEVLSSSETPESSALVKKKASVNSQSAKPQKTGSESESDSSHSRSEDIEVEVKPKKKVGRKGKVQISEGPKKRKRPAEETKQARKKKNKIAEETHDEKNNGEDVDGESSEKSESSAEKSVKVQKEVAPPVYGKKVERLKSIIKSCGMTVAPSLYKKAKQVSEDKREAFIIKELQEILSKEGLSTNPSEKEIKEVKRKKERAKELEGIDTSNIVLGSRRRSTSNFMAAPKPKAPVESDGDVSEDTDNEDDGQASQSEEVHEDTEDSD